jgi:hypothetical protein
MERELAAGIISNLLPCKAGEVASKAVGRVEPEGATSQKITPRFQSKRRSPLRRDYARHLPRYASLAREEELSRKCTDCDEVPASDVVMGVVCVSMWANTERE